MYGTNGKFWNMKTHPAKKNALLRVIPTMTFQNSLSHLRFYVSLILSGEGRHTTHPLKCVRLLSTSQTDWRRSSDILSDISFDILSAILSDISSDIVSDILSGISPDILSGILSDISSDILSDISCDTLSESPLPLTKSGWATDFIGINWVCLTPPTHNAL